MSLPKELLEDFDEVLKDRGYQSRSKGIRDALNDYILRHKWLSEMEGDRIGIITVIYDYKHTGIMEDLIHIQNDFNKYISSTMRIPISKRHIIDVIIVQGDVKYIRDLTEKLMRLKGVDHVKLTSISGKEKD